MPGTKILTFLYNIDFSLFFNRKYIFFLKTRGGASVLRKGPDSLLRDFHALAQLFINGVSLFILDNAGSVISIGAYEKTPRFPANYRVHLRNDTGWWMRLW